MHTGARNLDLEHGSLNSKGVSATYPIGREDKTTRHMHAAASKLIAKHIPNNIDGKADPLSVAIKGDTPLALKGNLSEFPSLERAQRAAVKLHYTQPPNGSVIKCHIANINPGKKAAVNSALIEVSVISPYMINTIEGGIIVPSEPEAQIVPIARF